MEFGHDERTWRPLAMGRWGAVAANHPLATLAGQEALRRGGNAADAAVAMATTLSVVEPHMSGPGGDGFFLYYDAATRCGTVINATGPAPLAATRDRYRAGLPGDGAAAASTPGVVDGWITLATRFGRLPREELFAAAVQYAREGFGCTRRLRDFIRQDADRLRAFPDTARTFLPGGDLPAVGQTIRQPSLAHTLETIAAGGSEAFYRGEIGRELARYCQEQAGPLALDDLASYSCEIAEPLRSTYRGLEILQTPPNSTGWVLLQELNIVEAFDLRSMGALSADAVHVLVEAKKLAYRDRERYSADPRFVEAPITDLIGKSYGASQAAKIDPRQAQPRAGSLAGAGGGETTYFCVVDHEGNAVSGIQSLSDAFGAAETAGRTGILLNNRMRPWHLEPEHPNVLVPGKRVRHTMNAPLALRDGQVAVVWGTPGSDAQVQVNLQTLTALVDFGFDPQQALEAPRWCSWENGQETTWPHAAVERLQVEDRLAPGVRADLERRGHRLEVVGPLAGPCAAQMIVRQPDGLLIAGSDPRRDGTAIAW